MAFGNWDKISLIHLALPLWFAVHFTLYIFFHPVYYILASPTHQCEGMDAVLVILINCTPWDLYGIH